MKTVAGIVLAVLVLAGCESRVDHGSAVPPSSAPSAPPASSAIFGCPMHPDVLSPAPGLCPKCQMALRPKTPPVSAVSAPSASSALDPVCGMKVPTAGPVKSEYQGKTFHFCGPACKNSFEKDPARYAHE